MLVPSPVETAGSSRFWKAGCHLMPIHRVFSACWPCQINPCSSGLIRAAEEALYLLSLCTPALLCLQRSCSKGIHKQDCAVQITSFHAGICCLVRGQNIYGNRDRIVLNENKFLNVKHFDIWYRWTGSYFSLKNVFTVIIKRFLYQDSLNDILNY